MRVHGVHCEFHLILLQCDFGEIQCVDSYSLIFEFPEELCCFLDGSNEERNVYLACHERAV